LKKEFVCIACFFAEFFVLENVHFDCEFCDSILIFSRLSAFEFVTSFVVSSTLKNLANENQSFVSFLSMKKKEIKIEKKIVVILCFFVCVFVNSSIENLSAFIFFVSELSFSISFVSSSAFLNSEKCEFVQEKEKKFFNEKFVIKNNVSNLCETNNSSFLSLNKFYVEIIKIEKKKKNSSFCFEFFMIDVLFNYRQHCQEKNSKEKKYVFWNLQLISTKSINSRRKRYRTDSKSSCEKRIIEIDISRRKNSVCHEKSRTIQTFNDDFISTSFANAVSLINYYARVKNFWNVSFRRL
jgi:hypothetical protein